MRVIIDGEAVDERHASISVFDWAVVRGLGAFEVIRSHDGRLFRLDAHLDRLERSVANLRMEGFDRAAVAAWARAVAAENRDGLVRVLLTPGGRDEAPDPVHAPPHAIVLWEPVPEMPERLAVLPMRAPWHPATVEAGFPGTKWLSYAPNMASVDVARAAGFDDALLTTMDDVVLEGPTWTAAWMAGGRLHTPTLDLGILYSITRAAVLECAARLGIEVVEGRFPLADLWVADEVLALSTGKQVVAVGRVGDAEVAGGPVAGKLSVAYAGLVAEELDG